MVVALAFVGLVTGWFFREPIYGRAETGVSYGAHVACSCRYLAGRGLSDCKKDFEPGMKLVFLSDDADDKSVTAYVPLIASQTAHYREGYGCVLEPWSD
ncbi:hypothetical protein GRI89_13615 [Altererythrobacter salegens]|uniref:Uncharacterized protein n=1 Tax=Croceibacterium salegens TaxID=1737568 RepID=A0A6I4SYR7_9SPHN|nr:hypothetical protein [Croceibacterium salegens]